MCLIRHWLMYYIADAAFDRNTAQRVSTDYDVQLKKALELLKDAAVNGDFVATVLAGRTLPDTLDNYSIPGRTSAR